VSDMDRNRHLVKTCRFAAAGVLAVTIVIPAFAWQAHKVGPQGPDAPPLQGAVRWHYLAPLPHARSEVAVAEVTGKV